MNRNLLMGMLLLVGSLLIGSFAWSQDLYESELLNINVDNMQSQDVNKRIDGARELGKLRSKKAYPHLAKGLNDSDETVRYLCAIGLGEIGDNRATSVLINKLNDSSLKVREGAVKGLGLLNDKRAVQPLINLLKKSISGIGKKDLVSWNSEDLSSVNLDICTSIIPVLGSLEDKKAVPVLLEVMNMNTKNVNNVVMIQEAILALGKIKDRKAVKAIGKILADDNLDPYIRKSAEDTLVDLGVEESEIEAFKNKGSATINKILDDSKKPKKSSSYDDYDYDK